MSLSKYRVFIIKVVDINEIYMYSRWHAVGWGTMLQAGRLRVRFPMRPLGFFNWPNPSNRTMVLRSTQPLTEMSGYSLRLTSAKILIRSWEEILALTDHVICARIEILHLYSYGRRFRRACVLNSVFSREFIAEIQRIRALSCAMWHDVVCQKFTDVSKERTASVFRIEE
jgi:hypothetical protein